MRIDNLSEAQLRDELQKKMMEKKIMEKRIDNARFNLRVARFEATSDKAKGEIVKALKTLAKAKDV